MTTTNIPRQRELHRAFDCGVHVYSQRNAMQSLEYVIEYMGHEFGPVQLFLGLRMDGDEIVILSNRVPPIPESAKIFARHEGPRSEPRSLRLSPKKLALQPLPQTINVGLCETQQ